MCFPVYWIRVQQVICRQGRCQAVTLTLINGGSGLDAKLHSVQGLLY